MKPRSAPYWYDRFPSSRRPAHPQLRGHIETRVAIVGGGLTGSACLASLAAARIPAVLIEAGRLGAGATAGSLGLAREDFDVPFSGIVDAHGLRAARLMWQTLRRASLDLPAALRRLAVKCDLAAEDLLTVTPPDRAAARPLRRDYEARRAAGLPHRWLVASAVARESALPSAGGIKTKGAVLDPYRACLGLAAAAEARGASIFERSEVRRIRGTRSGVEIHTAGGTVTAETVVVAASTALADLRSLRRHLHPRHGYAVVTEPLPAAVRRSLGRRSSVIRDSAQPPHFVRWLDEDRVLIQGADQEPVPLRAQPQALVQRSGQLMYELSLMYPEISGARADWSWSYPFDDTVDGLPYIGPHRNFPHHFFALGLGRHGVGTAWLAARLLLRQLGGEAAKGDELFGFARILSR